MKNKKGKIRNIFSIEMSRKYRNDLLVELRNHNTIMLFYFALIAAVMEIVMTFSHFTAPPTTDLFSNLLKYAGLTKGIFLTTYTIYFFTSIKRNKFSEVAITSFVVIFLFFQLLFIAIDFKQAGIFFNYVTGGILIIAVPIFTPKKILLITLSYFLLFSIELFFITHLQYAISSFYFDCLIITIFFILVAIKLYYSFARSFISRHELSESKSKLEFLVKKLELVSETDPLTNLLNRRRLNNVILDTIDFCKNHNLPISIFMLDIDSFKSYNDNYGHPQGDECLKQVAHSLTASCCREFDIVARYGGEEFLIASILDTQDAIKFADNILKNIRDLNIKHEYSIKPYVTVSIGCISCFPNENTDITALITQADSALYEAKKNKDCVVSYKN